MEYIYSFSGDCEDKAVLGNEGANLVTMTKLRLEIGILENDPFEIINLPN